MTAFSDVTRLEQEETSRNELQLAINEASQKLQEVRQERLRVEEEAARCIRETEQRMKLMLENREIVDALSQLGNLLQEEKHLSGQLDEQASSYRNQRSILEEQSKSASGKVQSLAAEIQEVKERLAELKAGDGEAQASTPMPTSKSRKSRKK